MGQGISNSSAFVVDMALEFNGEKKIYLTATAAYADSEIDEKARVLLFLHHSKLWNDDKPKEVSEFKVPQLQFQQVFFIYSILF